MKKNLSAMLSVVCCASVSMATTFNIDADLLDQVVRGNGTAGTSLNWSGQAEDQISGTQSGEVILPFILPDLAGETISSANLLASLKVDTWQVWGNVDVYGVRYSSSSATVALSDYAPFNDAAGNGTKIMDNFYLSGSGTAAYTNLNTDTAGDIALANWLNDQYAAGAMAGDYVFIRLQPDHTDAIASHAVYVAMANAPSGTTPVLSITSDVVVPEAPVASFTAIPTSGNAPLEVAFSDTSTGTVSNRFWTFGDGFTLNTTDKNISHTYTTEGLRTVQLIVSGSEGSSTNTMADLIDVAPPVAGFTIIGNAADTFIGMDTNGVAVPYYAGQDLLTVGDNNFTSARGDQCAVLVYQLPDLSGQSISNAQMEISLQGEYLGVTNYPVGLDLYGVRYDAVPTVLASDYAPVGSNVGNGTLLQDDVATLSEDNDATYHDYTPVSTDASGGAALAAWIAAQYDAGAVAGDYVFLRLNNDKFTTGYWNIISADHALTNQISTLTITLDSSGSTGEANFVYTEVVSSGVLKLAFSATGALDNFKLLGRADLTDGAWDYVPHSDNSGGPFALGDLSTSTIEGTNYTIFVETTGAASFYGIE